MSFWKTAFAALRLNNFLQAGVHLGHRWTAGAAESQARSESAPELKVTPPLPQPSPTRQARRTNWASSPGGALRFFPALAAPTASTRPSPPSAARRACRATDQTPHVVELHQGLANGWRTTSASLGTARAASPVRDGLLVARLVSQRNGVWHQWPVKTMPAQNRRHG